MSEIRGHSEGIWRTFAVKRTLGSDHVPEPVKEWLYSKQIPWSFQRYATTKYEGSHISYRIEFPDNKLLSAFRKIISKHCEVIAETSWDEKRATKRAYELGTYIYYLLRDEYSEVRKDDRYLLQAFHGMFNNLNRDYREEASTYITFLNLISPNMRYGLSIHDIDSEDD